MAIKAKAMDAALKATAEKRPVKMTFKANAARKELGKPADLLAGKKRPASPPLPNDKGKKGSSSGATSRREELLKQLKAVEDAIAKKRSKV